MNKETLKAEANEAGYQLVKKSCYQCSCYSEYPNDALKRNNGKWKCVDQYVPIKWVRKNNSLKVTRCRRKEIVG